MVRHLRIPPKPITVLRQIESAQHRRWESFLRHPTQLAAFLTDKETERERRGARARVGYGQLDLFCNACGGQLCRAGNDVRCSACTKFHFTLKLTRS